MASVRIRTNPSAVCMLIATQCLMTPVRLDTLVMVVKDIESFHFQLKINLSVLSGYDTYDGGNYFAVNSVSIPSYAGPNRILGLFNCVSLVFCIR